MIPRVILREVPCDSIRVADRHRKDMGDLEVLAASIATEGLLQPVGITEDNHLVFGARRLEAVRDILRSPTIAALVVNVSSILAGEYAENEIRKDFTPSERVAIGKTLEARLGERRGRDNRQNLDEIRGRRSNALAAEKAGFGNRTTYEQAKKVVEKAVDEVIARMDSEQIAVSAAALIAEEPPERQREIACMEPGQQREAVRRIRSRKDLPTPSAARKLALETGKAILDRKLQWQTGTSPAEREPLIAKSHAIVAVIEAAMALNQCSLPASEVALGIRDLDTPDMDFVGRCRKAALFLSQIEKEFSA